MKLAVMADLHIGLMPDGKKRLQDFYAAAQREHADMIVNLGDFAAPKPENQWVADRWKSCPVPHCMVLGNHDMDESDKSGVMQFYGLKRSYDTFVFEGVQFILLDTNHFERNGICYDYAYRNYFDKQREFLGAEQRRWLLGVLEQTELPCVLFSHEGLENTGDKEEVLAILKQYRNKIAVCINGHNHVDGLTEQEGIHFLDVISMSQHWIGETTHLLTAEECTDYCSEEVFRKHRWLPYVVPLADTMYEMIEIDLEQKRIAVSGPQSSFIGKSPVERGHSGLLNGIAMTAEVKEKTFYWG